MGDDYFCWGGGGCPAVVMVHCGCVTLEWGEGGVGIYVSEVTIITNHGLSSIKYVSTTMTFTVNDTQLMINS